MIIIREIWRQTWVTLVVALVMLALYSSLGRQLMPLVENYQQDLAALLQESLQQPVTIGSLKGGWTGISPVVTIEDINIGGADGIHFSLAEVELNLGSSIFYRQLVFNQIRLEGGQASIQQLTDTDWQLAADWVVATNENNKPKSQVKWPQWLSRQANIQLSSLSLKLSRLDHPTENYLIEKIRWRSLGDQHQLIANLSLGQESLSGIRLHASLQGELWPLQAQNGQVYVEVEQQDWSQWLAFDEEVDLKIQHLTGGAKGWLEIAQGNLKALYFEADVPNFTMQKGQQQLMLNEGKIIVTGEHSGQDWHMIVSPKFKEELPFEHLALSQINIQKQSLWQIGVPQLDIGAAQQLLEKYQVLPASVAAFIDGTAPTGSAENIRFTFYKDQKEQAFKFDIQADIKQLHSTDFRGIPALSGVNAKLQIQKNAGLVELVDAELNLQLASLYEKQWHVSKLNGKFSWHIFDEHAQLLLRNTWGQLHEEERAQSWPVHAQMSIVLPIRQSSVEPAVDLLLSLPEGPVSLQQQLVPELVGDEVQQWLNGSLQGGVVRNAVFALHSALVKVHTDNALTAQLYLDVDQASLQYLPEWPEVKKIQGNFYLDSPAMEARIIQASTLGGNLRTNTGRVTLSPQKQGMMLEVAASLVGQTQEGLQYFKQPPLQGVINHAFDTWQANGLHNTDVLLRIALGGKTVEPEVWISSELNNNSLNLADLKFKVDQVTGKLNYSSLTGVSSKQLTGQIFGGGFTSQIDSVIEKNGQLKFSLTGQGQAAWQQIQQWQPVFILQPIEGQLDYQVKLEVADGKTNIHIDSALANTTVNLPHPFGKAQGEQRPLAVQLQADKNFYINAQYQNNLSAVVALTGDGIERGQVVLGGGKALLPAQSKLEVVGQLPETINAEQWWETWQSLVGTTAADQNAEMYPEVRLELGNVDVWGTLLGPTKLTADYSKQWHVWLNSPVVAGNIWLPSDDQPIQAKLEYLRFEKASPVDLGEQTGSPERSLILDPWQAIDPTIFPAIDLEVADVQLGQQGFGSWKLASRPTEQGLIVDILDSNTFNLHATGQLHWLKYGDVHTTRLENIELTGQKIQALQQGFGLPVFIESDKYSGQAELSWLSSPAHFALENLVGNMQIDLRSGRLITESGSALKAIGALNIGSLSRRLKLDFSDLYKSGLAFDKLVAGMDFADQRLTLNESLKMEGPGGKFVVTGNTLLADRELDMKVAVVLPVSNNLPLVAILAGLSPPVAASIYVTEKLVGDELSRFTTANYDLKGTWQDPEMTLRSAFNNDSKGKKTFKQRFLGIFGRGG